MRIVLVDDNQAIRETFAARGATTGHEVVGQADHGHAGVERALKLCPDVVITDWKMPVLDGIEATRQIGANVPEVVVIALTSTADPIVRDAFLRAGAETCIDKNDLAGLLDALRKVERPGAVVRQRAAAVPGLCARRRARGARAARPNARQLRAYGGRISGAASPLHILGMVEVIGSVLG